MLFPGFSITLFQLRPLLKGEHVEEEGQQGAERAQEAAAQVEARDEGGAQGDPAGHGVRGAPQGQGGNARINCLTNHLVLN